MKDNITKKKQEAFVDGVTKGLLEMGAEIQAKDKLAFSNTKFKLNTTVGVLNITLYHSQNILYTVYAKFENVARAKLKFNCNPHSGKFNIHLSAKGNTAKYAIEDALMHFEATLTK